MLRPFSNEPFTDLTHPDNIRAFRDALHKVKAEAGKTYPNIIGGKKLDTRDTFATINPARPGEVLANFPNATVEDTNRAVETAAAAFETWKHTPPEERARYLLKASAEMRRRKAEFNATMVLEAGKSWYEA